MAELFKGDPVFAAQYLNQALQDGEPADLLVALRQMAQAHGGVRALAKETELNATQLYRTLSPKGNPELRSLSAVLKALGLRLAVQPAHTLRSQPDDHAAAQTMTVPGWSFFALVSDRCESGARYRFAAS